MYRVVWNTDYEYAGYRNSPVDPRPSEIDADRYEIKVNEGNFYAPIINFYKEDRPVAALFQMPAAILTIADVSQ